MAPSLILQANMPFIDIGANLADSMFLGEYNGSQKHDADLKQVLERAWEADVKYIIITAGNLEETRKALELASDDARLFTTGKAKICLVPLFCHPFNMLM